MPLTLPVKEPVYFRIQEQLLSHIPGLPGSLDSATRQTPHPEEQG